MNVLYHAVYVEYFGRVNDYLMSNDFLRAVELCMTIRSDASNVALSTTWDTSQRCQSLFRVAELIRGGAEIAGVENAAVHSRGGNLGVKNAGAIRHRKLVEKPYNYSLLSHFPLPHFQSPRLISHRLYCIYGIGHRVTDSLLDSWSSGHGFESHALRCRVQPLTLHSHISASITNWYNLVRVEGRWCPEARKVTAGLASHWPCKKFSLYIAPHMPRHRHYASQTGLAFSIGRSPSQHTRTLALSHTVVRVVDFVVYTTCGLKGVRQRNECRAYVVLLAVWHPLPVGHCMHCIV